jgi:PAS domain S-box-containing protein
VRTLSLLLDFGPAPNLNYREISALRHLRFLGDTVSVPEGVPNPWMLVGLLSLLLLAIFAGDASVVAWRRGERRQALAVGGSIAFFAVGVPLDAVLVVEGIVRAPFTATAFFLALVAVMGYQLSDDVLRAARVSDDLREREQQIALVADAADLGLWVWTTPQDTVWATDRLNPMLGFAPGEPISMESFLTHVHPEDREPTREALQRALDDESDYSTEYRVVWSDGRQRWIAAKGRVQTPPLDGGVRMLGVCMDITARKQGEVELVRLQAELAHVGRLSTMAQLASSLAHELNQPLGAILRNTEAAQLLLEKSPPDLEEVRAILADICKDDQRAGEVIDHMRALVKRRGLERVELRLAELVAEVVVLVQPDAASRKVRIAVEVPRTLPPVYGDRVHLQQVLLNLIPRMDAMAASGRGAPPGRAAHERMPDHRGGGADGRRCRPREARAALRAVLHHQARWHGPGSAHLGHDHRSARWTDLGRQRPHRRHLLLHPAGERRGMTSPSPAGTVFVVDDDASFRRAVCRLLRAAGHQVTPLALGLRVRAEPAGRRPRVRRRGPADAGLERPGPPGGPGTKQQSPAGAVRDRARGHSHVGSRDAARC